jgi:hypothetical protein
MRKQLAVAFGLAVVATPAFATKARLEALGEDNFGSYYINDNRNYFLNVARINDHKDLVTYEFGRSGNSSTGGTADSAANPIAQGGFTKGHGNIVYGLQFGNSTPSVGAVRALANQQEVQPWELMVGGDAGVKWGAGLTYENYAEGQPGTTTRARSNSARLRVGAMMGEMELFANVSLKNKAKNNEAQVDGDVGYLLGASTMVQNYRLFAEFTKIGVEYRDNAVGITSNQDADVSRIKIGAGRAERLNDRATLFAKLQLVRETGDDDGGKLLNSASGNVGGNSAAGLQAGEYTKYLLPLNVGLEYAATSWLDLRASVGQNLWSSVEVDPKTGSKFDGRTLANTAVRAGASLKFGEFAVDGLISTSDSDSGAAADLSADGSTSSGNGNLRSDNLMTRVSMIYRF